MFIKKQPGKMATPTLHIKTTSKLYNSPPIHRSTISCYSHIDDIDESYQSDNTPAFIQQCHFFDKEKATKTASCDDITKLPAIKEKILSPKSLPPSTGLSQTTSKELTIMPPTTKSPPNKNLYVKVNYTNEHSTDLIP